MMVALCVPSRGLIYSKTVESVINGMQALNGVGIATKYFSTHELPIPDSHHICVEKALADPNIDTLIFIEEDMYVFPEAMIALATSEADVTTLQYNDKNGSPHGIIHYNEKQEVMWAGLGATAIKRRVFEALGAPYFRTDHLYKSIRKASPNGPVVSEFEEIEPRQVWDEEQSKVVEKRDEYRYGGLDVDFYTRARWKGFKIIVLPEYKAHHFELVQLGEKHTNKGVHEIKQV